jgi:hypothetical protein
VACEFCKIPSGPDAALDGHARSWILEMGRIAAFVAARQEPRPPKIVQVYPGIGSVVRCVL